MVLPLNKIVGALAVTFLLFFKDLLAAFGGLIGLCTGFSLLSGAELFYFFTLRWWLQIRRDRYRIYLLPSC